ncbi:hypothetical protein [Legionella cardiaca]|uniref:Uncharacterized protein n=1 Tax=Legionella cardiaca TaxID=1071983 RepID=A0ABY8ASI7_9GAMM|nr:hypothetical protein [Legionella cardiaca]WED43637.1 hypothetical protein PXX05_02350 [Legionella cardiaca]
MKLPLLSELLAYENARVVHYFCHYHPEFNFVQGQRLLNDFLAWMWLNAYRKNTNRHTYLFGPLLILDKLWHAFILHTDDYVSFCQHYFGEYFHHHIEPLGMEHELTPDELADFLSDAYDYLGREWIERYFIALLHET